LELLKESEEIEDIEKETRIVESLILSYKDKEELSEENEEPVNLSLITQKTNPSLNEEFEVSILGENTENLHFVELTLGFDQSKLAIIKTKPGDLWEDATYELKGNKLLIFGTPTTKNNGCLVKVIFKAILEEESTDISILESDIRKLNKPIEAISNSISIEQAIPTISSLLQSFPNPANQGCYIPFKLSNDANVSLEIYNILGQKIRTIDAGQRKAGSYTQKHRAIFWDLKNNNGQNVSKGLYFYQLKAGEFTATKAMVVR
jgi:hypothetical protein